MNARGSTCCLRSPTDVARRVGIMEKVNTPDRIINEHMFLYAPKTVHTQQIKNKNKPVAPLPSWASLWCQCPECYPCENAVGKVEYERSGRTLKTCDECCYVVDYFNGMYFGKCYCECLSDPPTPST